MRALGRELSCSDDSGYGGVCVYMLMQVCVCILVFVCVCGVNCMI